MKMGENGGVTRTKATDCIDGLFKGGLYPALVSSGFATFAKLTSQADLVLAMSDKTWPKYITADMLKKLREMNPETYALATQNTSQAQLAAFVDLGRNAEVPAPTSNRPTGKSGNLSALLESNAFTRKIMLLEQDDLAQALQSTDLKAYLHYLRSHGNGDLATKMANKIIELEPQPLARALQNTDITELMEYLAIADHEELQAPNLIAKVCGMDAEQQELATSGSDMRDFIETATGYGFRDIHVGGEPAITPPGQPHHRSLGRELQPPDTA